MFLMDDNVIVGKLDREYMLGVYRRGTGNKWGERYVSEVDVQGVENLALVGNQQFVGFGNHQSHLDYMLLGRIFLENLPIDNFPKIVAGKNLDSRILSAFGLNFRRTNVLFVDREKIARLGREERQAYLKRLGRKEVQCLNRGDSLFDFIEGGRNRTQNILDSVKSGVITPLIKSKVDPLIINVAVKWGHAPETEFYPIIDWAKGKKGFRWMYYAADAAAIVLAPFFRANRKPVHFLFGEPRKLSEIAPYESEGKRRNALIDYVREDILSLYKKLT